MGESFQKLNLTNAYLFAAAMQDEEICRNVLEIALNKRISRVKAHVEQVLFLDSEFKSVRFDVYASDEEEVSYDVEMQNDDTKNLPKRCRYYQAELDVTSLRPGEDYQQLKPGYIIFICSFDPFGKGRCQYVFEEYCKEADIPLGDETQKIFFNTNGTDTENVTVSDRDYVIELLSALSTIMMHLSRFSEEIIIWNTNEYQFVDIDDAYSTGSSIMPQKKNPDIAELVRGKTGRVYAALMSMLTTMKGIPLAYNKDMQEDKELTFDAIDTVKGCLALFNGMLSTMHFKKDRMENSAKNGFTNATDAADYLVGKGVPFRDAHGIVGRLVLYCIDKGISLDDMKLEEYKAISPVFEDDIYDAISMKNCVERRNTIGAPGADAMQAVIEQNKKYLQEN